MKSALDNVFWDALTGPQKRFAVGEGGVRRYAPGFSPIVAFEDRLNGNLELLNDFAEPGESFYSDGWIGVVPTGWTLEAESTMFKMVFEAESFDEPEPADATVLGPEHAEQALELALLTHPGPFGVRTPELGEYFGYFDGPRLIAMAGERTEAGRFREISGVCTHPDYQGRGLARKLMNKLIRLQLDRGQVPFLHVMTANEHARGLYRRMGFTEYLESPVRVFSRTHQSVVHPDSFINKRAHMCDDDDN